MNAKEFAELLNNREYGEELTFKEEALAKENNLVIVFGESDDLVEFRGAIDDEAGCWGGGEVNLTRDGIYEPDCLDEDCPHEAKIQSKLSKIEIIRDEYTSSWRYETEIPHETFDILDDDEGIYCKGIVFSLNDLK